MRYKFFLLVCLGMAMSGARAQSAVDTILRSIESNNQTLKAERQRQVAAALGYKTGNTLENPRLEGEYLFGSPVTAGNQVDFLAIQAFDFPTVYTRRRQLAEERGVGAGLVVSANRQAILFSARRLCLEMIYRNKLSHVLERRYADLEALTGIYTTRLDRGDGTILDLNKARVQWLEIRQLREENVHERLRLQAELTALNGGVPVDIRDTVYPAVPIIGTLTDIQQEALAGDPGVRLHLQEKRISEKELELSNAQRLPSFEAGYHYQGILGQRFSGIHVGMTVPLWEHKYRREWHQAGIAHAGLALAAYTNGYTTQLAALYDRHIRMQKALSEFKTAMVSANSMELLKKALDKGEISTSEYFLEVNFMQGVILHYLELEHNYHQAVGQLLKHQL